MKTVAKAKDADAHTEHETQHIAQLRDVPSAPWSPLMMQVVCKQNELIENIDIRGLRMVIILRAAGVWEACQGSAEV